MKDPVTGESYTRDPRYVAKKAEDYLQGTGIADTAYFGPEAEFYIFDDVRFDQNQYSAYYYVDSIEGAWNSGAEWSTGGRTWATSPATRRATSRSRRRTTTRTCAPRWSAMLEQVGIHIEVQHHEVGTAGQAEIDMRFDSLLRMADKVMLYKYVVKNVAWRAGKTVTFMPKPIFQDNGSGMHVHQSLWKGGEPLFFDETGYAGLSDMARWYIGGLLKHAPAVLAFAAPTTNSYKRLVPGYEAPVNLVYSQRNRSASVRIPLYSKSPKAKRLEFRCPDPSCNPYLAFSAMLMAGLDGIQNRIEPPEPLDKDLYDLPPEELAQVPQVPGSLDEALDALEADHEFLLAATSSPRTSSTPGSTTSAPTRSTPSACARTRASSTSTTTSEVRVADPLRQVPAAPRPVPVARVAERPSVPEYIIMKYCRRRDRRHGPSTTRSSSPRRRGRCGR